MSKIYSEVDYMESRVKLNIQEDKLRINIIQLTSTLAKVLLSTPDFDKYDLSSVRICYFAGEVLPKEIADGGFLILRRPLTDKVFERRIAAENV